MLKNEMVLAAVKRVVALSVKAEKIEWKEDRLILSDKVSETETYTGMGTTLIRRWTEELDAASKVEMGKRNIRFQLKHYATIGTPRRCLAVYDVLVD